MVGLFNQIEKNCDIILQKILFVDKTLAMNAVKMEKQTDKMMSTLIAIYLWQPIQHLLAMGRCNGF